MLMVLHSILTVTGQGAGVQFAFTPLPRSRGVAGWIRFLLPERPGPAPYPLTISTPVNLPDSVWRIQAEEGRWPCPNPDRLDGSSDIFDALVMICYAPTS